MNSSTTSYDLLSSLLPSHTYTLVYALPLFFVSFILTFAGSFLTLDRTRSFAPSTTTPPQSTQKPSRICARLSSVKWSTVLEGGIGGLASGYVFGVHFSTFLALLIPNTTSSGPVSSKAFVALWFLSAIPCTLLGGRWKYAAIVFSSVTGFATLALSLSVIVHPTLLARIAMAAVFTPIGVVLCLLPFPRVSRASLRVACASAGAFGMVLTIALMARVPAWGNVWERFWVQNGSDWATSKEKGLSAAYCLLLITGTLSDWFFHHRFGENPDEKWDRYLADYTADLPNDRNRAGTFTPLLSFWDKMFGHHHSFAPVVPDTAFSYDSDLKLPLSASPELKLSKPRSIPAAIDLVPELVDRDSKARAGFLRKKGTTRVPGMKRTRPAIKFRPLDEEAASSDDDGELFLGSAALDLRRSRSIRTDSSATLTNSRTERYLNAADADPGLKPPARSWTAAADVPDYSDYESDVGAPQRQDERGAPGWTPEFIRRHSLRAGAAAQSDSPTTDRTPPAQYSPFLAPMNEPLPLRASPGPFAFPVASVGGQPLSPTGVAPMAAVPATPSLIRAVERINVAQEELYRAQAGAGPGPNVPAGLPASTSMSAGPGRQHRTQAWNSFWNEVKTKANS